MFWLMWDVWHAGTSVVCVRHKYVVCMNAYPCMHVCMSLCVEHESVMWGGTHGLKSGIYYLEVSNFIPIPGHIPETVSFEINLGLCFLIVQQESNQNPLESNRGCAAQAWGCCQPPKTLQMPKRLYQERKAIGRCMLSNLQL